MKCSFSKYSLLAALTLSLPFALVGCNKSSDTDMTSPSTSTPPPTTAADTNSAPATTTATETNNTPAPADSTKGPEATSSTDTTTPATASPNESSKTNNSGM